MQTREVPYEQWPTFFNSFTDAHQNKHINVETLRAGGVGGESGLTLKPKLHDVALVGVAAACPKSGRDDLIEVVARDASGAHANHAIDRPSKVQCAQEDNGQTVALQIESADGTITMIRFEPPRENMPAGFTLS